MEYLDRSNAVNLARNILREDESIRVKPTEHGIAELAKAVLAMDEELRGLYELLHKTEDEKSEMRWILEKERRERTRAR